MLVHDAATWLGETCKYVPTDAAIVAGYLNENDPRNLSPLHYAVVNGDHAKVRALCTLGADPNLFGGVADDMSALHLAAVKGDTSLIQILRDAGADVNLARGGFTDDRAGAAKLPFDVHENPFVYGRPLHYAAFFGNVEAVRLLHGMGADLEALSTCQREQTALVWAVTYGEVDVVRVLIELGADVDTAVDQCCDNDHLGLLGLANSAEMLRALHEGGCRFPDHRTENYVELASIIISNEEKEFDIDDDEQVTPNGKAMLRFLVECRALGVADLKEVCVERKWSHASVVRFEYHTLGVARAKWKTTIFAVVKKQRLMRQQEQTDNAALEEALEKQLGLAGIGADDATRAAFTGAFRIGWMMACKRKREE